MTNEEHRPPSRETLDLGDCSGNVLLHEVADLPRRMSSEMARTTVTAELEIEDVVPGAREVVEEAP